VRLLGWHCDYMGWGRLPNLGFLHGVLQGPPLSDSFDIAVSQTSRKAGITEYCRSENAKGTDRFRQSLVGRPATLTCTVLCHNIFSLSIKGGDSRRGGVWYCQVGRCGIPARSCSTVCGTWSFFQLALHLSTKTWGLRLLIDRVNQLHRAPIGSTATLFEFVFLSMVNLSSPSWTKNQSGLQRRALPHCPPAAKPPTS